MQMEALAFQDIIYPYCTLSFRFYITKLKAKDGLVVVDVDCIHSL